MLSTVYQPMIGSVAISLYTNLYQQLPADRIGYSALEQQRRLFLSLAIDPNEQGRKMLIEQFSKLEAIGLLQTYRKYFLSSDDYVYEYHLQSPLLPQDFFSTQHLTLLLRDKVGKHMVMYLKQELEIEASEEIQSEDAHEENISIPFYELFTLNTSVIDYELEQALAEMASTRTSTPVEQKQDKLQYADIIMRIPRESINRRYVEALRYKEEQLETLDYIAKKYSLTLMETCRLLDEEEIFHDDGTFKLDNLQYKANLMYRQDLKRDEERERYLHKLSAMNEDPAKDTHTDTPAEKAVEMDYYLEIPPMFLEQCNIHQYNMLLRNEPYTHVLKRFFPGVVPDHVVKIFEKIDLSYKLKEEVINVLIHYLKVHNLSWNKAFIDSIAADMLGKQINTYEQAVAYTRSQMQAKKKTRKHSSARRTDSKSKPNIPIVNVSNNEETLSNEEYEELFKLAREIEGKS